MASSYTIHGYTSTRAPKHTERGYKKMALISIKDVKQAIEIMMRILEKLDEIYHALHDQPNEKE